MHHYFDIVAMQVKPKTEKQLLKLIGGGDTNPDS